MADYAIAGADLSRIERNLSNLNSQLGQVQNSVDTVDQNIRVVYDELNSLAKDFNNYVKKADQQHNVEVAHTELVRVRQELKSKFGHYAEVRRSTTGILQATDVGVVKRDLIENVAEELMVKTPNYWLTPCLVTLGAWISGNKEIAERALKEGIRRDDEKTSLLMALICQRAGRKRACLLWTKRYLDNQDPTNVDGKCIIILDAYASGLLGADSEGVIADCMTEWLEDLASQNGFTERQIDQWSNAINMKRKPYPESEYTYLPKYSPTWSQLKSVMEGAYLHAELLQYFMGIFEAKVSQKSIKEHLDSILDSLVTDFDAEELPLRQEETYNQLVIKYNGDLSKANSEMNVKKTAFAGAKDFTQVLTDASMNPDEAHSSVSTRKFATALSKEWIVDAYNDIVVKNRMSVPQEVEIKIDKFTSKTQNGENENQVIADFNTHTNNEEQNELALAVMTGAQPYYHIIGGVICVLAIIMIFMGMIPLTIIGLIIGGYLVFKYFRLKKSYAQQQADIRRKFTERRRTGAEIIRGLMAELVDFRYEFEEKDAESEYVLQFFDALSASEYVTKRTDTSRRIVQ